jgi:hypothetical protein
MLRVFAIALVAAAACKGSGSGGGDKPVLEREMVVIRGGDTAGVEYELTVPKGFVARTKSSDPKSGDRVVVVAGSVVWEATAGDKITIEVTVGNATPLQNAINLEMSEERRTSRTDTEGEGGWIVTSHDKDGTVERVRRQVARDGRGVICVATATWQKPGHEKPRTESLERICRSLTATKI